ncbi:hypothetical protein H6G94_33590 [Nostoc punctiforme FACHB-252]|uniref:Uncharacterized protein n=1 Tax=Nostoc punctiforme FACHB-252 TaxID=1357509 RepID=A0ABR8HJT7_NOSPU|nr:hypothetical protein [Nostoc punctiforme]MBD2616121.1 hypothetical protein [Nostoc punctiforme FACHB-252]
MSDVFDRLKKKGARPTVPTRDTSLVKKENTEIVNDQMTEFSHSEKTEILNDQMTEFSHSEKTEEQDSANSEGLKDNPTVSPQEQQSDLPQTVRRTIRLEQDIDTELDVFCTAKKVTRDTFIEAAFIVCSQNEELMHDILEEAKKRYHQRKQAGEQRKFQTMAKKINT